MGKAISAQNQVRLGQRVANQVQQEKPAICTPILPSVVFDELSNNVTTNVFDIHLDHIHPEEVATRNIEKRLAIQFFNQLR
jgi:hypothetical protein